MWRNSLRAFWRGELSLAKSFWEYALLYGALVSLITSGSALALFVADAPVAAALAVHILSWPYLLLSVVGVYRSANRYTGRPLWAQFAKAAVVVWAATLALL